MNRILTLIVLCCVSLASAFAETAAPDKKPTDLRVLMIGNSFSQSVLYQLPHVVHSVSGLHLSLTGAVIGGCTLQRHWENIVQAEKDPFFEPYAVFTSDSLTGKSTTGKGNLQKLLSQKWDIITLQQASHDSWRLESYQPYFGNLVAFIRKNVPEAEIMIQQTWAYRNDDSRIAPDTQEWGFDQTGMYERLTENYKEIAGKYKLRLIPVGLAVQLTRKDVHTVFPRAETIQPGTYSWPDLPSQAHEVVGSYFWGKNSKAKMVIKHDSIHLNARGHYLQACVWLAKLYGVPTSSITYIPPEIDNDDAIFLQKCAQEAVDTLLP